MAFQAMVYRILIAGPGDAKEERDATADVVLAWNRDHAISRGIVLLPVLWELDSTPSYGRPPQATLNEQMVDHCDALIGIFKSRLGSPTEDFVSGTAEEIQRLHDDGKEVLVYFYDGPISQQTASDPAYQALRNFRNEIRTQGLYGAFDSITHLEGLCRSHVSRLANSFDPLVVPPSPQTASSGSLASQIKREVNRHKRDWEGAKGNSSASINGGKEVMSSLRQSLRDLEIDESESTDELESRLSELIASCRALESHRLYLDGGHSLRSFWDGGDDLFRQLAILLDTEPSGQTAGQSRPEVLRTAKLAEIEFLRIGTRKYDSNWVNVSIHLMNSGQHMAQQISTETVRGELRGQVWRGPSLIPPGETVTFDYPFRRFRGEDGSDLEIDEVHRIQMHYRDGIGSGQYVLNLKITGCAPDLQFSVTESTERNASP